MTTLVIVIGILAAVAAIVWFVANRKHPETTADHDEHSADTRSERFYDGVDRPAGPDATTMDPDALGGDHRPPER